MAREPKRFGVAGTIISTLLIVLLIAAIGMMVWMCIDLVNAPAEQPQIQNTVALPHTQEAPTVPAETTVATEPPTTAPPEPEKVIATATIASQGDLLMHSPVFNSCKQSDGTYNYESIFRYVKDYVSSYDYALANLETTFGGPGRPHQPNQAFSCPDGLELSAKEAGYDALITVNNHCGDTGADGVIRTLEVVRAAGLTTLGTRLTEEEPRYTILDLNGIKVGMVAYSWAFGFNGTTVSMNGLLGVPYQNINFFRNSNLEAFYEEVEPIMAKMKEEGADVTMMEIHWGIEYDIHENETQNKIAQKLCDIGFDVIVGGHPHVVQPVEMLTSTVDASHKTAVIYSLGNAVSNQRSGVSTLFPPGYTEDGVLFGVTFEKYSDGTAYLADVNVLPTWVNMRTDVNPRQYNILPLDNNTRDQWTETFELNEHMMNQAEKSYDRTMGIVGEGLEQAKAVLAQQKADREQYYLDLANGLIEAPAVAEAPTVEETTAETAAAA